MSHQPRPPALNAPRIPRRPILPKPPATTGSPVPGTITVIQRWLDLNA